MCGFVGFTGKSSGKIVTLNKMLKRIVHRGPDMAGEYIDDDIALGFRRQNIIGFNEEGAQLITSEDNDTSVLYNGRIYNGAELRGELKRRGHCFRTECETEIILNGYKEYGKNLASKLRGMFAFAVWDKKSKRLYGARDCFGIKPFYYTRLENGELLFGSEIKSFFEHPDFVPKLNEQSLLPYLTFQYSAQDETFFSGVYKLAPAHYFILENGEFKITRYWDVNFEEHLEPFDEAVNKLDSIINESVKAHSMADVKIGTFLSGGVDSSYITAANMPDKTFSVGFDYNKFNETNYAKELSEILGIKNYSRILTADECFDAFPEIQYHMDEPQSNPSSVPLYFLCELAREHVNVVLSGEGADELFGGYEWYDQPKLMAKYKRLPAPLRAAAASAAGRLPYFKGHDFLIKGSGRPEDYFIGQAYVFPEREAFDIITDEYKNAPSPREITAGIYSRVNGKDELIKKQYLDLNLWLPGDILLKADKMSMAHSLEVRVPFLDQKVMAYAMTLPGGYKISDGETKRILRRAAAKTIPGDWANRPKVGFPVPIRYWLADKKYCDIVADYFSASFAAKFFDQTKLMKLLDEHFNGRANNGRKIWTVFTFLVWYKRFFIDFK